MRWLLAAAAVAVAAAVLLGWLLAPHGVVTVRVATTTSLYATGLLDYLKEEYEARHPGVSIEYLVVGSGRALRLAASGDACLVFSHAPNLEAGYLERGELERVGLMAYNYFVVVGPSGDPAGVRGAAGAVEAFRLIYGAGEEGRAVFVSRGDESGTHARETLLWRLAGLDPEGRQWYLSVGAGMAETLVRASELGAYTLSDTGTFLKLSRDGRIPGLEALYTGDPLLMNVYSIYVSARCTGEERRAALDFARFILDNQDLIASYGVDEYGQPLFHPARGMEEELMEAWRELASLGGGAG